MTRSLIAAAALGCLTLALAGCATSRALPSVGNKDNSPRTVGVIMADEFGPAISGLADACEAGLINGEAISIITDYGPTIRQTIGTYAATARACVVTDGALTSDPASGGECFRGSLKRVSGALPAVLKEAGQAIGGERGRELYLAGLVASTFIGSSDGGLIDGFKHTSDVTLAAYDAAWAPVQADADRLAACALPAPVLPPAETPADPPADSPAEDLPADPGELPPLPGDGPGTVADELPF